VTWQWRVAEGGDKLTGCGSYEKLEIVKICAFLNTVSGVEWDVKRYTLTHFSLLL